MKIAILSDPHFHDITYRAGHTSPTAAIRTLGDTATSTRVFNESFHGLPALLDDIVRRGISLVIIAGDLTDDGQGSTTAAAVALLHDYSRRFGLRFLATPGNHDLYAMHGRHQSKRFLNEDGSHTLVTSDPREPHGASVERIVTPEMYCGGYLAALNAMRDFGFFRRPGDLHWESPFGPSDDLTDRTFDIRSEDGGTVRSMIDASYLVEPLERLWVLSIDANVFEPKNGDLDPQAETSFIDSTDAGWNAMLRNKPFMLDWMTDVACRASALGKRLIAFSHYPAIDLLGATLADEIALFGETGFSRRAPQPIVMSAVAQTGIKVHFSGHLHVNDTARWSDGNDFLVNVAVPSIVAFPPAYKTVEFEDNDMLVQTVPLPDVLGFDTAFDLYRRELSLTGEVFDDVADAASHGDFLSRHLIEMVRHRYLPKEWPTDLAALVTTIDTDDLALLADASEDLHAKDVPAWLASRKLSGSPGHPHSSSVSFFDLIVDWYRLRNGRDLARAAVGPARITLYRNLARAFSAGRWGDKSAQGRIARIFRMMMVYVDALPSRDFRIDLSNGDIERIDYFGRTERRQTG